MNQLVKLTVCLLLIPFAAELSTAQTPELVLQTGVSAASSIAFSPDGKILASCGGWHSTDHPQVKLWDAATGTELRVLEGSADHDCGTFSPDGKILVTVDASPTLSRDRDVKIWNVATGVELRTLKGVRPPEFSPDGKTLGIVTSGGILNLSNVVTGAELRNIKGVSSFAFSPDGKTLAAGNNEGGGLRLLDVATGSELRPLPGHPSQVQSIAFSPDGRTLASGSNSFVLGPEGGVLLAPDLSYMGNTVIKLWDVATATERRTLKGRTLPVKKITFSPDGKNLTIASHEPGPRGFTELWDVASGTELQSFRGSKLVAYSSGGKTLAAAAKDGIIKLWDFSTQAELRKIKAHSGYITSLAFSPDGKTLASAGDGHTVTLWQVESGAELQTLRKQHAKADESIGFSPDGKTLALGTTNNPVKLRDVLTGDERILKDSIYRGSFAFSSDGKSLATVAVDFGEGITLWDVASGRKLRTLPAKAAYPADYGDCDYEGSLSQVAFSPDGKTVVSRIHCAAELWNVRTGMRIRKFKGSFDAGSSIAFSPDGKTLAGRAHKGPVKLWSNSTGAVLHAFPEHSSTPVAFSPDGKTIAINSDNGVELRSVATGERLRSLEANGLPAFSPDGETLAIGDYNGAKLCDLSTGAELPVLDYEGQSTPGLGFSANNENLIGTTTDGINIWEARSGKKLASFISLDDRDWIVVTPDGLFDGSPAAWSKIVWRFNNNTLDYKPVETYFSDFYHPGLLADIFAGKRPKAPADISQKDRRQPQLKLTLGDAKHTGKVTARDLKLKISIAEIPGDKDYKTGSGAQDVRLFRNGSVVKVWRGDVLKGQSSVTLEATIPIVAGENKFTAYAFNHDNIKSTDAELTVTGAENLKRQGTAYILAVGVDKYTNRRYDLKYAVADAVGFAAEIKRQQESLKGSLKRYAKVEVIPLANGQATKANITGKLAGLAKNVQPEDAVIVFFAGHGTAQGNQFYLIPHDLGYDGPRENLSEAGLETILAHSISDREMEKLFEGIDSGQLLLVIDACNSGQALEAEEKRRGPMNSKGLAQLAYEKGMYVMTAAQSYQAALEAEKFGHGYLTHALVVEGLKKGSADRQPKNGSIDIREWLNFATDEVPKLQENKSREALRGRSRYVVFVGDGRREGIPQTAAGIRDNVQRPRVFYRRELEANPLVVATVAGRRTLR